jgi:membrane-associated protein
MHFDLTQILPTIGLVGIAVIVFAESGLLIGFFLPGDSLLFTAGFLASQGIFNIWILAPVAFIAAVLGDSVGYAFGQKIGKKIFHKKDSLLFHRDNIEKAQKFYEQHGKKTIILARFVPIVRTFAPIVAGVGDMHYHTFLSYNIIGGLLWGVGITVAGYFLGKSIPNVDKYLLPIVVLIIVASIAPSAWHILKEEQSRKQLIALLKKPFKKTNP